MAHLTIIRGLPGSGKSTLAKRLGLLHIETDMYMTDHDGNYNWTPQNYKRSQIWCFNTVCLNLNLGVNVVIAGVMAQEKAVQKYVDFCNEHKIPYKIIRCLDDFGSDHDVPDETLTHMKNGWEPHEGEEVYGFFGELES